MAKRYKPQRSAGVKKTQKSPMPPTKRRRLKSELKGSRKEEAEVPEKKREERFDKAFLISLALIALFTPLIFIPGLGPLMVLTLVPYIACNIGCRYVRRRNGVQVGLLIGIIWSIIEVYLLFFILTQVKISVSEPAINTSLDAVIIILLFLSNIIFCVIGGYTGGAKFEVTNPEKVKGTATDAEIT